MRWLVLLLLASCGSKPAGAPVAVDVPPIDCASSIVVRAGTQTLIVTGDDEQAVGAELPKLACARGSVVRIYGDGSTIAHDVEKQGLRARVSPLAPQPVIHASRATLGDLARLVPTDFSFETQGIIVTSQLVGQDIACNDRYMGPSRHTRSVAPHEPSNFDQTPRWGHAVIRRAGPYVVVELPGDHSALMTGRCGSGTGCNCIPVSATRLIAIPRTSRPITFKMPPEDSEVIR